MLSTHIQLIVRLQTIASLLGYACDGFGDDDAFNDEFTYNLVANKNGQALIKICGLILVSTVGMSLGGSMNSAIHLFVKIFEVLLARMVSATYDFGDSSWCLSWNISVIDKCLASNGTKR